jgi:predicted double-glycine peptidase
VPLVRQATDYTCGVACTESILYYNGIDYREDNLAQTLGATEEDGTDIAHIVDFLHRVNSRTGYWMGQGTEFQGGIGAELRTDMTLDDLRAQIDGGHPVICAIQAWSAETNEDYAAEWEDGHYVIAVGYDDDNVYFMDPSTRGNYTYIANDEFMTRWHDGDSDQRLQQPGIVITNPNPVYDPDVVLPLG